uniref:Bm4079 n=1 Tax=Brugia malayi TaxID=6279 RepID=A0A0H5SQA0_BRUMA|nr:Bm4079 [Brugia malayi]
MTAKSLNAVLDNFLVAVRFYHLAVSAMSVAGVTADISSSQATASGERQSAAAASVSAAVPSSSRWIFTHEQLMRVPSVREGMSPEEELKRRRVSASTIHQMADRLNHESRVRISQLCICAAMMHMHRFFVFHSFFKFDPRDIAAACLFLAGKSEECPRKLDHVVRVWWAIKFPHSPNLDNNRLHEASQLIVTLENLVLQTIAFDLSVDIPHPYVLTHMQKFARDASGNRRISEIAYWFASDMLHMTNWGVRYTAKAIACVCIQMACLWAEFEVTAVYTKPAAKTLPCRYILNLEC